MDINSSSRELKSLLDSNISDDFDRLIQTSKKAKENKVTIASKGFPGIIGTTSGEAYLTGYDTRVFSRAGFGDILAGKIAGFFLSTVDPELAVMQALLDGSKKAKDFENLNVESLEPIHLI